MRKLYSGLLLAYLSWICSTTCCRTSCATNPQKSYQRIQSTDPQKLYHKSIKSLTSNVARIALQSSSSVTAARFLLIGSKVPVTFCHVDTQTDIRTHAYRTQTESRSCRAARRRTLSDKFNFSALVVGQHVVVVVVVHFFGARLQ